MSKTFWILVVCCFVFISVDAYHRDLKEVVIKILVFIVGLAMGKIYQTLKDDTDLL